MREKQNIKVAVDAVVFGYKEEELYVLLIQRKFGDFKDSWALPGGFVLDHEDLDTAVRRELKEEAGIKVNFLEQLYTFGGVNRDPRQRIISVAYFALANPSQFNLKADTDAKDAQWFPLSKIKKLPFDHKLIIKKALDRARSKLLYQPLGFNLLKSFFPFSDLEKLYQTILGQQIDRRNFRKKIMSYDILEETGQIEKIGSGRPAKLFRFNKAKYKALEKSGFHFEIKYA